MDHKEVKNYIENELGPRVQADGGEIVLNKIDGKNIHILAMAECAHCRIAESCLKDWLELMLNRRFDVKTRVHLKRIIPYYLDKQFD